MICSNSQHWITVEPTVIVDRCMAGQVGGLRSTRIDTLSVRDRGEPTHGILAVHAFVDRQVAQNATLPWTTNVSSEAPDAPGLRHCVTSRNVNGFSVKSSQVEPSPQRFADGRGSGWGCCERWADEN